MAVASGSFMGFIFMIVQFTLAFVLWLGGRLVMSGSITIGELTTFLLYVIMVATNFSTLAGVWPAFMTAVGASEKVFYLLDRVPAIAFAGGKVPTKPAVGQLDVEGVWFHYNPRGSENHHEGSSFLAPDTAGTDLRPAEQPLMTGDEVPWVLEDINLSVAPGSTVALVGPSGAGKSTVFSLLERFYAPQRGTIRFDGMDIMELDPAYLRGQMSIVAQEPVLFADTIFNNIAYGVQPTLLGDDFDLPQVIQTAAEQAQLIARVEDCAKAANAHEFISTFQDGYQTVVGERGVKLSGGQCVYCRSFSSVACNRARHMRCLHFAVVWMVSAENSVLPSQGHLCSTHRCCCSTRPHQPLTPSPSTWCRLRLKMQCKGEPSSSLHTD